MHLGLQIVILAFYMPDNSFMEAYFMNGISDREKAFENKFVHDEALKFKAEARRNKLLGVWAAGLMGRTGEAVNDYAKEVIKADFEEVGDEDVFRKLRGDLDDASVSISDDDIRKAMVDNMKTAIEQIGSK